MESEFALVGLEWSHFLRRTGSHFAGKCSRGRGRLSAFAALMVAASLVGCGGLSSPSLDGAFEQVVDVAPEPLPPYRKLVAAALRNFKEQDELNNLEISEPRWAEHLGGPAWLVCVKFSPESRALYYAFFIRKEAVIESRFAVGTDRCARRSFAPFDLATVK
jgi:hypothetical protein